MLTMLFETGHPWITFKDPCNIRSPQQHIGVVHSSNLCTEITLNTNDSEIAVCNLGSVNLANHLKDGKLDAEKIGRTVKTAMRMLDNVIDINYYAVRKARNSNLKHRPVGMGLMAFQDCLHTLRIPYASDAAVQFADESMELIAYHAYWASTELAEERGTYPSYKGSLWDRGILPQDSNQLLAEERGGYLEVDTSEKTGLGAAARTHRQVRHAQQQLPGDCADRDHFQHRGRGCFDRTDYQNLFVKSNLSGEFTVINEHLVHDLKERGLWDEVMISDLKYFDGSVARIDRIPQDLREQYATAFEMEPKWLVEAASRRQKWLDQAQSLNIYMAGASGKKLDDLYKLAWLRGLKTTYYLRTLSASSAEKSTGRGGELNSVPVDGGIAAASAAAPAVVASAQTQAYEPVMAEPATDAKFCSIDNPDCEACQ